MNDCRQQNSRSRSEVPQSVGTTVGELTTLRIRCGHCRAIVNYSRVLRKGFQSGQCGCGYNWVVTWSEIFQSEARLYATGCVAEFTGSKSGEHRIRDHFSQATQYWTQVVGIFATRGGTTDPAPFNGGVSEPSNYDSFHGGSW